MSENKETVKQAYEKFETGDLEGLLELLSEDIEWTTPEMQNAPLGGTRRGREGAAEFFQLLDEHEEMINFEPKDFIAEGDKVVVLGNYAAKIKSTGREVNSEWVQIFTIKDGKITNFHEFYDNAAVDRAYQKADTAQQ